MRYFLIDDLRAEETKRLCEHLDAMDQLRQGINLRAYAQRNPVDEYKNEAFDMFQQMISEIQSHII